jgi:cellulose synthase/poly-beta-1,6-N-acetylglucosamine synthase-like glycosyltransferase
MIMQWPIWIVLAFVLYSAGMLFLFLFSLVQLDLLLISLTCRNYTEKVTNTGNEDLPFVTIQLPVYNEKFVVERLLDAVFVSDYPKEKLEIQILDDSDDETVTLIDEWVLSKNHEPNPKFSIIRRSNRAGFKAGALQEGLVQCKGSFIAIFDADFVPPPDFLKKVLHHFQNEKVGAVQTRWGHLNEYQNLLTRLQAFGLDAHFTIEQPARYCSDSFLNFNGTAGVWRKSCIEHAGGWSADTLTEDLDLSFRAQLKGWRIVYDDTVVCPAELPATINPVITQQQRWNKGGAETARKLAAFVMRSDKSVRKKMHGLFQLGASSVFPALFIAALSSLFLMPSQGMKGISISSFIGLLPIALFYLASGIKNKQSFLRLLPVFLMLNMGLSRLHTLSMVSGWFGKKSPFIRTPKISASKTGYVTGQKKMSGLAEGFLGIIFSVASVFGIATGNNGFLMLHLMMACGFLWVSVLLLRGK